MNNYFEILIKRLCPTLKRITCKLNGHYSFFNEEDLYQEALIHLWGSYRAGKLDAKTDSYILQSCYFYLKNYLRKVEIKADLVSLDAPINESGMDLKEILSLETAGYNFDYLASKIIVEKIRNNGLTKRGKEVLALYLEGFTVREIGQKLGISHVRVIRLKNKIRDRYAKFRDEF